MIKETIAKRLQDFRKMMGLSQAALAKKTMAITKSSIEKIEKAEMMPAPQTLSILADVLGVMTDDLIRPYVVNVDYSKVRYRKRSKMPKKEVERLQRLYGNKLEKYIEVERLLGAEVITAKPKAHAFKNEMCFPLTKTKCELKKHPNSKFECFFNDFNRTKTSLFLPFPSKLIQDNLVCVLELQE